MGCEMIYLVLLLLAIYVIGNGVYSHVLMLVHYENMAAISGVSPISALMGHIMFIVGNLIALAIVVEKTLEIVRGF